MTIRTKLFACLASLGVAIATLAGLSLWQMDLGRSAIETIVNDRVVPMRDLKVVADKYAVDIVNASHKARNGDSSFAESAQTVQDGSAALKQAWNEYRATGIVGEELQLALTAEVDMEFADQRVAELQRILSRGDQPALDDFVRNRLYQSIDPVSTSISELVDFQLRVAEETARDATASALVGRNIVVGLVALAMLVLIVSFFIVSSKVVSPVRRLAVTIRDLASANGSQDIPHQEQKDEIGDIARSVETFRQAVVEGEQEKARASAQATKALGEGLSNLAKGDLTYRLDGDFPSEFRQLKSDFNDTAAALCSTIAQVAASAVGISNGANDIRQASDDLSMRTEQQAASLEETVAAMDEVTSTVSTSASKAKNASNAVRAARDEAIQSGQTVERAVEAMDLIERTSAEINEIISLIDGIAFQTNLLALNAGVEAARAGDAGKGFAVVASEVRALAQRSADAATEVKTRITASSRQVETGVELVGVTGRALQTIIQQIGEVDALVSEIAETADQQATGLQQINTAVSEMDGVTQQNAAMVEEATAAARSLAEEVEGMMQSISRFSVGGSAKKRHSQPVDIGANAASNVTRIPSGRMAGVTIGNTAVKMNEDEWDEF